MHGGSCAAGVGALGARVGTRPARRLLRGWRRVGTRPASGRHAAGAGLGWAGAEAERCAERPRGRDADRVGRAGRPLPPGRPPSRREKREARCQWGLLSWGHDPCSLRARPPRRRPPLGDRPGDGQPRRSRAGHRRGRDRQEHARDGRRARGPAARRAGGRRFLLGLRQHPRVLALGPDPARPAPLGHGGGVGGGPRGVGRPARGAARRPGPGRVGRCGSPGPRRAAATGLRRGPGDDGQDAGSTAVVRAS